MHKDKLFRFSLINAIYIWLFVFAVLPLLCIITFSFLKSDTHHLYLWRFTLNNYKNILTLPYLKVFWRSVKLAFWVTLICLLLGYPFAYYLTKLPEKIKPLMTLFVIIPFWTSSLLRSFAIITIIQANGILNELLLHLHMIHKPLQLLYTNTAVLIGLVYNLLPFVILPLFANMERLDLGLLEAAQDLGANRFTQFFRVLLPLTSSGIFSAVMLTFLPAMTLFYIPDLLGGAKSLLLGNLIQMQFFTARNWPMGSAVGIGLTLIMSVLVFAYFRNTPKQDREAL
jgi:spermidine/putrescine transport system permease protein